MVLAGLIVKDILTGAAPGVETTSQTSSANPSAGAPPSGTPTPSATLAAPNCSDGIQNQDEAGPDCGGPCSGHWYDEACHPQPKPDCADDDDCGAGKECQLGKCVAAPECAADADCPAGEECKAGACEAKALSGALDIQITDLHIAAGTGPDLFKVDKFDVMIDNGLPTSKTITGTIYYYKGASDPFVNLDRGSIPEIVIQSGEKLTKTIDVPNPVSRPKEKGYIFKVTFTDETGADLARTKHFDP